jgi:hypothetical protein
MSERADHRRELHALAYAQAGYFTARQARVVGFSYQATKIDRGLFRLPGWPSDRSDTFTRWCVWSEGDGVISHQSAALLQGFGAVSFRSEPVHITMPPGSSSRSTQITLHPGILLREEIEVLGALRITNPTRTLVDLARLLPQEQLNAVVYEAGSQSRIERQALQVAATKLRPQHARKLLAAVQAMDTFSLPSAPAP